MDRKGTFLLKKHPRTSACHFNHHGYRQGVLEVPLLIYYADFDPGLYLKIHHNPYFYDMNIEDLRYPIGKFKYTDSNDALRAGWINDIAAFPSLLKNESQHLSPTQLLWKYRPEGWTIRQVIHHCADSHINAQMRFKLALTENTPTIKPYLESKWATLADINEDVQVSLDLLTSLHKKWVYLLKSLSPEELARDYIHPEHGRKFNLDFTIAMYSWHCRHHHAHVVQAIKHSGHFH